MEYRCSPLTAHHWARNSTRKGSLWLQPTEAGGTQQSAMIFAFFFSSCILLKWIPWTAWLYNTLSTGERCSDCYHPSFLLDQIIIAQNFRKKNSLSSQNKRRIEISCFLCWPNSTELWKEQIIGVSISQVATRKLAIKHLFTLYQVKHLVWMEMYIPEPHYWSTRTWAIWRSTDLCNHVL